MRINQSQTPDSPRSEIERQSQGLIGQAERMLNGEAYHYCADCHTHCRQMFVLAEAFKEAVRVLETRAATEVEMLAGIAAENDALRETLEVTALIMHKESGNHEPDFITFEVCRQASCVTARAALALTGVKQ